MYSQVLQKSKPQVCFFLKTFLVKMHSQVNRKYVFSENLSSYTCGLNCKYKVLVSVCLSVCLSVCKHDNSKKKDLGS